MAPTTTPPPPGSSIEECLTWLRRQVVEWHGYGVVKVVQMSFVGGRAEGGAKIITGTIELDVVVRIVAVTVPARISFPGTGPSFSEAAADFATKALKSGGPLDGLAKALLLETKALAETNRVAAERVEQQWRDVVEAYDESVALVESGHEE